MAFQENILGWYDKNRRDLPWRAKAGIPANAYHVWLSEIMLQQTTVATVKSYFLKFLKLWPDIHALAKAEQDDILTAWAGLGYYARARNLHACAKIVAAELGGVFPSQPDQLQKLPGIGPYTSGAIAAIAFDFPAAAVDGNVERVLSRFYAITVPLPDSKPEIKSKTDALVPDKRAGDFAQSLMDLGATICTPRKPACAMCPLNSDCIGLAKGLVDTLPRKKPKKPRPTRHGKAFIIQRADGAVLLRRRPDKGLLGGMLEVPCTPWLEGKTTANQIVEHTFTHFHLMLEVVAVQSIERAEKRDVSTHEWTAIDNLANKALPTVMKKVLAKQFGADVLK